ncbi:MAG: GNAT family N-acetyltransferase [Methanoculleus horonobensis]|jgi:GNAT superfamily N-acetyltransferase|nr:GNAT family N-acetyltransferase [Methanoculleus horonobensis]
MEDIPLRRFSPGDLEDVSRLVAETIEVSYAKSYPREAIDYFLDYHTVEQISADADRGCTFVIEPAGRIVGTGTLLGTTIKRVFVHPSRQRRGYGALLMRALEREALRCGIRKVDLSASLPSKRFYDGLGYTTECEEYIPVGNGRRLDYYVMVKALDEGR